MGGLKYCELLLFLITTVYLIENWMTESDENLVFIYFMPNFFTFPFHLLSEVAITGACNHHRSLAMYCLCYIYFMP